MKPGDGFVIQLVIIGNIGALVVKKGVESLYRQATKSKGKLSGRDNLFFLTEVVAVTGAAAGTGDFLCTDFGISIVAASIARSSTSPVSWDPREID